MVQYSLKARDQANDSLSVYMERYPDAVGPRILLAQIALERGQHETAVEVLEPALERSPGNQRVLLLLAEAHMREGQHLKASTLLQLAIEAGADTAVLRTQMAVNEFGLGRQGEAIAALASVFDIQPQLSNAGATLVVMLLKNHRYDEAVETAKRLVVEAGPNLTYVNLLGVAALAKDDLDLAYWAFDLVLTLDPTFLPARLNLADLSQREGAPRSHSRRPPGQCPRAAVAGPFPGGPGPDGRSEAGGGEGRDLGPKGPCPSHLSRGVAPADE